MTTQQLTFSDADQITIALGPILCDGFQDGEMVSIERPDAFTKKVGTDGKVTRSKNLDRSATITITLMSSSLSNDLLSSLLNLDVSAPNGAGVLPLYIRDRNGRALYTAAQAWISKPPPVSLDQEATPRAWVIDCAKLVAFDGGN